MNDRKEIRENKFWGCLVWGEKWEDFWWGLRVFPKPTKNQSPQI